MSNTIVTKDLDYSASALSSGEYEFTKIFPQTALTSIGQSYGAQSVFEISPRVMNLGRSVLSFKSTPDGDTPAVGSAHWQHVSTFPFIRAIQLYTKQGYFLADINNFAQYMKVVSRLTTTQEDLEQSEPIRAGSGYINGLHANNTVPAASGDGINGLRPTDATAHVSKKPYMEAQYCLAGAVDTVASPVTSVQLELSKIPFSVFMDKDTYFGESVYLKILWNRAQDVLFNADDLSPVTTATAYTGTLTISDLTLFNAVEINREVEQAVMNKYNAGTLSYPVDYVYTDKETLAGTRDNLTIRYQRGNGQRLKFLFCAPFNGTEAVGTTYDHSCVDASDVVKTTVQQSYYTTVNNERTTQYNVVLADGDPWMIHRNKSLKGCAIQSNNEFLYNHVILENWTHVPVVMGKDANIISGIDLDTELIWRATIDKSAASTINYYTFAIISRQLQISPAGIVFQ